MNLLFLATNIQNRGKYLWDLYHDLDDKYKGEFYLTIDDLVNRLRHPKKDLTIAVLLADSQKELENILSVKDFFSDVRIILILPDRNKNTIIKGHTLFPRFLTYVDSDFNWVTAVLEKMLSNNNGGNKNKYQ